MKPPLPTEKPGPGRREARERAISLLYEAEVKAVPVEELVAKMTVIPLRYAVDAASGADLDQTAIDEIINDHADGWRVGRMPALDRAILRLAVWELRSRPEIPVGVILDEAVELAKQYSTENSARFINGVLAAVAASQRQTVTTAEQRDRTPHEAD